MPRDAVSRTANEKLVTIVANDWLWEVSLHKCIQTYNTEDSFFIKTIIHLIKLEDFYLCTPCSTPSVSETVDFVFLDISQHKVCILIP